MLNDVHNVIIMKAWKSDLWEHSNCISKQMNETKNKNHYHSVQFIPTKDPLTVVLLNPDLPFFENGVDPDRLASGEASWSGSTLFSTLIETLNAAG